MAPASEARPRGSGPPPPKANSYHLGRERIRELHRLIDRNIPVGFLVYRPDELEGRLAMGDPFLKAILRDGRVLYGGTAAPVLARRLDQSVRSVLA